MSFLQVSKVLRETVSGIQKGEKKMRTSFYVVEHEGQHNPITKSFDTIKEAYQYFYEKIDYDPILYEVIPRAWIDPEPPIETYN